jgi:hypothetical protein
MLSIDIFVEISKLHRVEEQILRGGNMNNKIRVKPQIGNTIMGDNWTFPEVLREGDDPVDAGYPGCQFRVNTTDFTMAVNIKVTGGPHWAGWSHDTYKSRIKIEFVGDYEESTFSGGWLYHKLHQEYEDVV